MPPPPLSWVQAQAKAWAVPRVRELADPRKEVSQPMLEDLVKGIDAARLRARNGCRVWVHLGPALAATEMLVLAHLEAQATHDAAAAALAEDLRARLRVHAAAEEAEEQKAAAVVDEAAVAAAPVVVVAQNKREREPEPDEGDQAAAADASPRKRLCWVGETGERELAAQVARLQRDSPRLSATPLTILAPRPEAFLHTRPPTAQTRVDLACADCGIQFSMRLGSLLRSPGLTCLCHVRQPASFDGQLLRCSLDPSVEHRNLVTTLAKFRPSLRVLSSEAVYAASPGRLVEVECTQCGVVHTRAVNRRVVCSELGCRCKIVRGAAGA